MFERFTDRAREVMRAAQEEALGLGHNFIGTEHLLLGLVRGEGLAASVLHAEGVTRDAVHAEVVRRVGTGKAHGSDDAAALASIGIDLDEVRATVEEAFGRGALERGGGRGSRGRMFGGPSFTPRTKKALELALRAALAMKHGYIGTEHLLLGTIRLGAGVAYEVLRDLAGPPADLREKVVDELKRYKPGA
jgi:ATP-dependent Clp protease ATP-binding subunit ClpA